MAKLTLDKINAAKKSAPLKETERAESGTKKKGRPAKAPVEVKKKRIQSYYTDDEYEIIQELANASEMTLGAFQRKIVLEAIAKN